LPDDYQMVRKPDDKTGIIISMRILLIEDDQQAASYLVKGLAESGYVIDHAADGEQGLNLALSETYDILVVDRMLPKRDGLSLIRMLRADGNDTPILVLSALGEVDDRVEGLRSGGDDYLIKPYAFAELLARLEALVRRRIETKTLTYLKVSDLELNQLNHKVSRARQLIRLQPMELRLLEFLMRHEGQVVTRTMLLEQVWDLHFNPQTNVVDTQISRLRSKIDKDFDKPLLHTLRGIGYKLDELA
jgi:two-component system OmpR family response regulator